MGILQLCANKNGCAPSGCDECCMLQSGEGQETVKVEFVFACEAAGMNDDDQIATGAVADVVLFPAGENNYKFKCYSQHNAA